MTGTWSATVHGLPDRAMAEAVWKVLLGDGTDVPEGITFSISPDGQRSVPDVDALAEALHDAMCDISHHDHPPARCSKWAKYPHLAQSVHDRLERWQSPDG